MSTDFPASHDADEQERRQEAIGLLDDLKAQLRKAEATAEEYRRQLEGQQARLDDASQDQRYLEDRVHEQSSRLELLEADRRDLIRQQREAREIAEAERTSLLQERERMATQEEESRSIIQKLKETLAQKDVLKRYDDEHPERLDDGGLENVDGHLVPRSKSSPSEDQDSSPQQDKTIKTLRLELAEMHNKLMESENKKGGRVQDLERMLMETRMANARLREDQEGFQLLLSQKTLTGEFSRADVMQVSDTSTGDDNSSPIELSSSLADELDSAAENGKQHDSRLEAEVKSLKDQNRALTVYINNFLERLLQHKELENILERSPDLIGGAAPNRPRSTNTNTDKDLPPPPPPKEELSVFTKTRSLISGGRGSGQRPRPFSQIIATDTGPTPSIGSSIVGGMGPGFLRRSDSVGPGTRREISSEIPSTAAMRGQTKRGSSAGSSSLGPLGSRVPLSRQSSLFSSGGNPNHPNPHARVPSGPQSNGDTVSSSANSIISDHSGETDTVSPPRPHGNPNPNAAIAGNRLRPLRLVQENADVGSGDQCGRTQSDGGIDWDMSKKARRSSWMGWFNKGKVEDGSSSVPMGGEVVQE